jgi:hypothetical protein
MKDFQAIQDAVPAEEDSKPKKKLVSSDEE